MAFEVPRFLLSESHLSNMIALKIKSLRGPGVCLLVFRLVLNTDIHSDKATAPCQGDLKY